MIYFIFDNPADEYNMAFLKKYETSSFRLIFPQKQCLSIKSLIVECKKCIDKTECGDTIICWYDFMGILCWWICKFTNKKRNIIALNILLKDKKSFKNKIARILYRGALKSTELQATVTSTEYGSAVNELLGLKKKYTLLHDIYHGGYRVNHFNEVQANTVFCGGRNGRDWEFLLSLAKEMQDVVFNIVMPKNLYEQYKGRLGHNVVAKTEIPECEFLQIMCQSSLVLMPLDTEAPAGLIAMFQAAANEKMIVVSDTVSTREYFSGERGVLCKNSIDIWKKEIKYWLEHTEEAQTRAIQFKMFLENECSEEKYAEALYRLVSG